MEYNYFLHIGLFLLGITVVVLGLLILDFRSYAGLYGYNEQVLITESKLIPYTD